MEPDLENTNIKIIFWTNMKKGQIGKQDALLWKLIPFPALIYISFSFHFFAILQFRPLSVCLCIFRVTFLWAFAEPNTSLRPWLYLFFFFMGCWLQIFGPLPRSEVAHSQYRVVSKRKKNGRWHSHFGIWS